MQAFKFSWEYPISSLKEAILGILHEYDTYAFLDSNEFYKDHATHTSPVYSSYELLVGAGAKYEFQPTSSQKLQDLKIWLNAQQQWYFGHLSYDLKNELERLSSSNSDYHRLPDLYGFIPEWVLTVRAGTVWIYAQNQKSASRIWEQLQQVKQSVPDKTPIPPQHAVQLRGTLSREVYIQRVQSLIDHIIAGDVYEINFCQAFHADDVELDPVQLYRIFRQVSPSPFACLYKLKGTYVISASMERFMAKFNDLLISQPIKGTTKRQELPLADQAAAQRLLHDPKERAENVMIVDLVRNDLAKSAKTGSVHVDELFGIYPFSAVYQMISTISARMKPDYHGIDALANAFPMGSMTGAPKVSAMQLIDQHEDFKRSIFSGAVGYITPWQDFDFNVIIRSFIYDSPSKSLTLPVGSAITYDADPEQEYEECLIKIQKLKDCLYKTPITHKKSEVQT